MNFDYRALFVGDLSNYCTEQEITALFSTFGSVSGVQLHNGAKSGRATSYAFVSLGSFEAVELARRYLDGHHFCGRKIKVRRATIQHTKPVNGDNLPANSLQVRFMTYIVNYSITEFDLHRIFSVHGLIEDIIIKDCTIDSKGRQQSGLAFIHFITGPIGVQSCFAAAEALNGSSIDGLLLRVDLSRSLQSHHAAQFSQLPSYPAALHPTGPSTFSSYPSSTSQIRANGSFSGHRGNVLSNGDMQSISSQRYDVNQYTVTAPNTDSVRVPDGHLLSSSSGSLTSRSGDSSSSSHPNAAATPPVQQRSLPSFGPNSQSQQPIFQAFWNRTGSSNTRDAYSSHPHY